MATMGSQWAEERATRLWTGSSLTWRSLRCAIRAGVPRAQGSRGRDAARRDRGRSRPRYADRHARGLRRRLPWQALSRRRAQGGRAGGGPGGGTPVREPRSLKRGAGRRGVTSSKRNVWPLAVLGAVAVIVCARDQTDRSAEQRREDLEAGRDRGERCRPVDRLGERQHTGGDRSRRQLQDQRDPVARLRRGRSARQQGRVGGDARSDLRQLTLDQADKTLVSAEDQLSAAKKGYSSSSARPLPGRPHRGFAVHRVRGLPTRSARPTTSTSTTPTSNGADDHHHDHPADHSVHHRRRPRPRRRPPRSQTPRRRSVDTLSFN